MLLPRGLLGTGLQQRSEMTPAIGQKQPGDTPRVMLTAIFESISWLLFMQLLAISKRITYASFIAYQLRGDQSFLFGESTDRPTLPN
ncbi:hypothetical protein N9D23_01070 [Rubripirellula sp.]|nr:hypothetical protein [Rubripirellula sp.]